MGNMARRREYRMMPVMRIARRTPRTDAKERSRQRIVEAAARAIRRTGYDGTSVADLMQEAGLTHGAFYSHFASREALLAEATQQACAESATVANTAAESAPHDEALRAMVAGYLSEPHLKNAERGCPLTALGSETPRQSPEVRRTTTRYIKEMIDLLARQMPNWGRPEAHDRALVTMSTMVGALILARAVDDPALAARLLDTTRAQLTNGSR
jgi:AcrR family transcriptional regulator